MNTSVSDNRDALKLREARRIERIYIYHRWPYVVAVMLMALVYPSLPLAAVIALAAGLGAANLAAWYLYRRLGSLSAQSRLSFAMLAVDGLASWGLMLLFIQQPSAIIYAIFTLVVIEGAVRFGLTGSLLTGAFFIIGLSAGWLYRVIWLSMSFDLPAYVFWVGLITLVSIMIGMVVRESRKQRAYAQSLATERTLLLERRRISNELHDTVLKSLQGLALEAHALGKSSQKDGCAAVDERARYMEEVCNSMSQEIRGVVFELRDEEAHSGIRTQVTALVERWRLASGIAAELEFSGVMPDLPIKLSHDLRRIIGEALTNVQRHAGASLARVSLASDDGHLALEVADNGKGFDCGGRDELYAFVKRGKLGLVSMKERVELAGGSFDISSNERGTRIAVVIPLDGAGKEPAGA